MLTTHIGSLPFTSVDECIEFNKKFDLPVLSTLPLINNNEFMIEQVAHGISGAKVEQFKIYLPENLQLNEYRFPFVSLNAFVENFKSKTIKWQILGPVTFIQSCSPIEESSIKILLQWHLDNILHFHNELKKKFKDAILFLDEPLFQQTDSLNLLKDFCSSLKEKDIQLGIHCCSHIEEGSLNEIKIDFLSYDSSLNKANDFNELTTKGVGLCPGIVSTIDISTYKDDLNNACFVAPSCGLAFTEVKMAQKVPIILSDMSKCS